VRGVRCGFCQITLATCLSFVNTNDNHAVDTGELAEMAPVGRELVLLPRDQPWFTAGPTERRSSQTRTSTTWVDGLPPTFSGRLTMSTPEYLVEVSEMETKTMVPLDSEIRLQVRDGDYECLTCCQQRLGDLISMPASRLPRIVRIVAWDEVRGLYLTVLCMF